MSYTRYSWRAACADALAQTDPDKLLACMESAITALEARYAQWEIAPGTTAELNAIRETILALGRYTEDKLGSAGPSESAKGISETTEPGMKSESAHPDGDPKE